MTELKPKALTKEQAEYLRLLAQRFCELDEEWFDDKERREEHAEYIAKVPAYFVKNLADGLYTTMDVKLLDTPRSTISCYLTYNPEAWNDDNGKSRPEVSLNVSATGILPLDSADWFAGQLQVAIQIAKEIERKVV